MSFSMRMIATGLCLVSLATSGAPAPWYKWKSRLDGKIVCTQTSPGEGWLREGGAEAHPYPDARCAPRSSSSAASRMAR